MKKLMSLLKATMSQDMNLFKVKSKQESKIGKIIFPIFLALILMFSIGTYAVMFAEELAPYHLTYIILTMFIMITSLLTLIEGVYKSQGILFEAKDNDLLFSLPISKSKILFTRLFKMISFQFIYNSLFMLPVIIVYAVYERPNITFYLISIVMLILLPIIPTILACIIGYIIKGFASRFKAKNIVQVLITTIMLLLIFYASFNMQDMVSNIVQNANSINEVITKIYYPAGLYINLIQNFNVLDLIKLLAISIIPAVLFVYVASIFYFQITSKFGEKGTNRAKVKIEKVDDKTFNEKSQLSGLINKEMKRFFSSPVFIINAGFALVLILVATIALAVNFDGMINAMTQGEDIGLSTNEIKAMMPKIFYAFVVFASCMTCITSSMISLEGKSFNITKSLPVAPEKILLAKVLTSNIISIPVILISDIIFLAVFKVAILDIVCIILASIIMPTFTAILGLLVNLKYPKMDATSDTEVVKQSMSSMISVFVGMFIGMISGIMMMWIKIDLNLFMILELLIFVVLTFALWQMMKRYGVKKFREINV